jgi:Fe-S cluster assembly protein SufD
MTLSIVSPTPQTEVNNDSYLEGLLKQSQRQKVVTSEISALIQELRDKAVLQVAKHNFPTKDDEEWRFTDLSPLLQYEFKAASAVNLTKEDIQPFLLAETKECRLVFVNGFYSAHLSDISGLPEGVYVGNLTGLSDAHNQKIVKYLDRSPLTPVTKEGGNGSELFTALNTAGISDIAVIWVEADVVIDKPIHLLFVTSPVTPLDKAGSLGMLVQPRCLIVAEANAKVQFVEYYGAMAQGCSDVAPNNTYLTNSVTEICLEENAEVNHTRIQRDSGKGFHIGKSAIAQGRNSRYTCNEVNLGASISRHNLEVNQLGEQTETYLNGLTMLNNRQVGDTHSVVSLTKPYGITDQLHKCIVDNYAHSIFNGKVFVPRAAQMTNAAQLNRNLVLSSKARVDTKPELQITADNVKCSHGATVSQLQADELFYLQSRGLSEDNARNLLLDAFAGEILQRIPVESLRQRLIQCVACRTF